MILSFFWYRYYEVPMRILLRKAYEFCESLILKCKNNAGTFDSEMEKATIDMISEKGGSQEQDEVNFCSYKIVFILQKMVPINDFNH